MLYYCIVSDIFVPQSVGFTIGFATALAPDMSPALSVALVGATFCAQHPCCSICDAGVFEMPPYVLLKYIRILFDWKLHHKNQTRSGFSDC